MSSLSDVTMQLSLWGHKPSLWYLLTLSKNISSHFMAWNWHKHNKEGGDIFIIFINYYFSFIFSFFFQYLDSPSQKITMRDFHQEVIFKQYFYLHQQFIFLCANCLIVSLFFFFFFWCVCVYITLELMNRSLFKNLWVGPDWRKKLLKERSESYFGYKKSWFFRGPISMYF